MDVVEKLNAELRAVSKICGECFGDVTPSQCLFDQKEEAFLRMFQINAELIEALKVVKHRSLVKALTLKVKPTVKTDARRSDGNICFLTVNPDEKKISLSTFLQLCCSFHQLVFVERGEYVFEQRSTEESTAGKGFHLHSIFYRARKPSVVRSEIMRTFLPFVGNENHIKIKFVDESQLPAIRTYMSGTKKPKAGQSKSSKVEIDQIWRNKVGLRALYTS